MTNASNTEPLPNPWERMDAARKAGFEARERGDSESDFVKLSSQTEKNAWLAGYRDSMVKWHTARLQENESETLSAAQREGGWFINGEHAFENGLSRDEAIKGIDDPSEWRMVQQGWDYAHAAHAKGKIAA